MQGCSTCDSSGRNCKNETESGKGVEGADFVLYITAITTDQVNRNLATAQSESGFSAWKASEGRQRLWLTLLIANRRPG